jgi:hypothetical protein
MCKHAVQQRTDTSNTGCANQTSQVPHSVTTACSLPTWSGLH